MFSPLLTLPLLLLLPLAGSLLAACLPDRARTRAATLAGGLSLLGVALTASLYPAISQGAVLRWQLAWMPQLGLDFSLRLDGLAWLFALLVQGIGALVALYARYYMAAQDPVPRFFAFLLAFMGAMLGIVLSGNLIQLVVFWELTSLASFLLIGYWHHRLDARRGARMAFTVTAMGGLALFLGVLLLGRIVGSYDLDAVLAASGRVQQHAAYLPALLLISLGALTKSAQFPFHFWLPHAMAAPTPVSAYLHSATLVKVGIFLLLRLWPVLSGTPAWSGLIVTLGAITLLLGAYAAIFQHDLKGLLAYSTLSHLGLITVLLGLGTPLALVAAIFHTLNHATFKASLFMAAGIVDHECGTRDLRQLRGLGRVMPITAVLAIVASAAMAGVPLLNGFLSKEMFFAQTLSLDTRYADALALVALAMGMFSVTYSLRFISIFFGRLPAELPRQPHEPPRWMRLPMELLVLACLVVGVLPALSIGSLLELAARSVLGPAMPQYDLTLWHGLNRPLIMSALALAGGAALYLLLRRRFDPDLRERVPLIHRFSGAQAYESVMLFMAQAAATLLRMTSTSRLQVQLRWLVLALLLVAAPLGLAQAALLWQALAAWPALEPQFALLLLLGMGCALAAAWQAKYHRLAALVLLGGCGVVTTLSFLWLSAPDLALTQLMVETVTMVLLLLGLRWLPPREVQHAQTEPRLRWRRVRDLVIAVLGGLTLAGLSYAALQLPVSAAGSGDYFLLHALSEGGGRNAVNVLLVDFRGFDTLGEISVLTVVALTVYALLRRFRPALESLALPRQQRNPIDPAAWQSARYQVERGYLRVPAVYLRLLLPFMQLCALYFFLRGHDAPGGGFVAGLIFAISFITQYMLGGVAWLEGRVRLRPHRWLGFGLTCALATGLAAWLWGYPFLTSHTLRLQLPLLGELALPSAFFFDLGVFAVVVGASMLILTALAHQRVRAQRQVQAMEAASLDGVHGGGVL